MRERREHYISATYTEKGSDLTFRKLVRTSKVDFLKEIVVNAEPPPEREVVLVIVGINYEQMLSTSLERVFGFVFEDELCVDKLNLSPKFMTSLNGLLARVLHDNQNIKHYGLSVRLFVKEGSTEQLKYIYAAMKDMCIATSEVVNFDIIQGEQDLRVFLKGELRRIVHGDIKAAYEALSH
jgi:hypothetical protein